jgi:ABC-type Fe3+-siderophore transport system permease subunit
VTRCCDAPLAPRAAAAQERGGAIGETIVTRPPSILRFERLYLASFGLGLVGWAVGWRAMAHALAADPRTAPFQWFLPLALVIGVVVTLLQLYFVARRGSAVAKWIVTVFTGVAVLRFLMTLPAALQGAVSPPSLIMALATLGLSVAATIQLFHDDTRAWFGEDRAVGPDGEIA